MPRDLDDNCELTEKYSELYSVAPNCFNILMGEVHDIDRDNDSAERLAEEVAELTTRLKLRDDEDMDRCEIKAGVKDAFYRLGLKTVVGHILLNNVSEEMVELIEVHANREADKRLREYQVNSYSQLVDKLYAHIEQFRINVRRIEDAQAAIRPVIVTNLIATWIALGLTALAVARLFS